LQERKVDEARLDHLRKLIATIPLTELQGFEGQLRIQGELTPTIQNLIAVRRQKGPK
jgi:hypothetical protein